LRLRWFFEPLYRPEGFDVPLDVVVARLDRALGEASSKLMHRNLEFWRTTKNWEAIESWRQQQVARMFSLSEFMKAIRLRFSRWFNPRNGRWGTLWEGSYTSVIVEEAERALRTIALSHSDLPEKLLTHLPRGGPQARPYHSLGQRPRDSEKAVQSAASGAQP
jgi:hypothetical protein